MSEKDLSPAPASTTGKIVWSDPITLNEPVTRGEKSIESIQLRKPKAGELRGGLTLQDLLTADIAAILKVLPRICEPKLTPDEVDDLDPADLAEIGGTIRGFFMTKAERQMVEAMMAEQQPRS